jgi:hypothetical protein
MSSDQKKSLEELEIEKKIHQQLIKAIEAEDLTTVKDLIGPFNHEVQFSVHMQGLKKYLFGFQIS